ncbi:MAG: hypothetical protein M0R48_08495 [Candidatus Omnitrophica bacterium]|nr:hypothetical protein [Candidatus Omnitrophota bacterium]
MKFSNILKSLSDTEYRGTYVVSVIEPQFEIMTEENIKGLCETVDICMTDYACFGDSKVMDFEGKTSFVVVVAKA